MKYCYRCGRSIGDDFEFCPFCGTTAGDRYILRPDMPVYEAEPVKEEPVPGGRVMAGFSKGLGIPGLVLSVFASSLVLFLFDDLLSGVKAETTSAALVFLFLLTLFSLPALLLAVFAEKRGTKATAGKIFGIIGCSISSLLLLAVLLSL